ncbi:DUF4124 domain-containing protein [Acidihalobacter prosperus]|uniref:DUF4124 domain-containing protein n=1 Tax=Acidihalobacter prosperus TaxID=160660 RepID=A0A1A6C5U3_9GAMM|nr:DUF4124 domain-containing protein [Acidihalobacter prosperus]OBS09932.1 hypothetical protein Thpro_020982 [Acidihalobacter prosperus]
MFLSPLLAHGAIYKWIDAQGVTHYSQMPPSGHRYTVIDSPVDAGNGTAESAGTNPAPMAPESAAPKDAAPKPAQIPDLKQRCQIASSDVKTLEQPRRVRIVKPDGSVEWMSDSQRAQRLKQAQAFVERYCKGD